MKILNKTIIDIVVSIIFLICGSVSTYGQTQLSLTATVYHAVPEQCNSDPDRTATNFKLDLINPYKHRIIAVSRDLESKGFKMNDKVLIYGAGAYDGVWTIRDRMNKRWTNRIDFLINIGMPVGKWNNTLICKI
jgi:3D (Asp-Asp-Asp) domain-containing protein